MADSLTAQFDTKGVVTVNRDLPNRAVTGSAQIGVNSFPSLVQNYTYGNASGQIMDYSCQQYTIAGSGNQDIDLAGGLSNDISSTITALLIKEIIVALATPDGTAAVRVGPQGVSNPFQGPFGGTVSTSYITVLHSLRLTNPYGGWTVTAGTGDILRINNPGGSSVTINVLIGFTK